MTIQDCIRYKTRYIENLQHSGGTINRERVRYLKDELATLRTTQTEIDRLHTELESMKRRYLGLLEIYETSNNLESFYSNLLIKTLSQNGKERSSNNASNSHNTSNQHKHRTGTSSRKCTCNDRSTREPPRRICHD